MKEKKGRLYKFYGKLTIRNKLLILCLPFVVLGYFLIFYSTTVIMFDQMKQMVYDQTEQNVMEKKKLVNTLLDNYNQATIKFLYYTDEVQEYLNTRQSVLSVEEQEKLTDMISYQIGSLITNNQDALMNVCIYNKFNELYINNAIYYNTIEQTNDFAEILKEAAEEKHGKPVLRINPVRKNMITFARNIYCCIRLVTILYSTEKICYTPSKTVLEDADMPRYIVTLTNDEIQELKAIIQKGGKGYRIKHAQILLKLDQKPENKAWTYDRIKDAYGAARSTIAGIAQRFVMGGMEAALGRKVQENRRRKVTGDVEARICAIACSEPPEGASRWTMQAIADELIRLEVVDYITDSTVCEVMKKMKSSRGS